MGLRTRWIQCSVSVSWAAAAPRADTDLTRRHLPRPIPMLWSAGFLSNVVAVHLEVGRGAPK